MILDVVENVIIEIFVIIGDSLIEEFVLWISALHILEQVKLYILDIIIARMLLKKCKILPLSEKFVREYFEKEEDMCSKCYLNLSGTKCLMCCGKANFNRLLFSSEYKYAYVVEKV